MCKIALNQRTSLKCPYLAFLYINGSILRMSGSIEHQLEVIFQVRAKFAELPCE